MTAWTILDGECVALMAALPAESVDAIVTDPPYGLAFMGKAWDGFADPEAWHTRWATEAFRVMKPGAHLLAFGGTRTFHRLACALEDAGFELRDCLVWLYGSGFPKSLDVSKAIDKAAGAARAVVGEGPFAGRRPYADHDGQGVTFADDAYLRPAGHVLTEPATDAARQWVGWGTALKPAWEPILLARKPVAGTVAANVQAHGTGALHVDGCRIAAPEGGSPSEARRATARRSGKAPVSERSAAESQARGKIENRADSAVYMAERSGERLGRWPANVVLDPATAAEVDAQSGEGTYNPAGVFATGQGAGWPGGSNNLGRTGPATRAVFGYGDLGGASRFFYTPKADQAERNVGLAGRNVHPTVKPVALMRWLCRLVTPPGGLVLDPFAGSGSTGVAALQEGFRFLGMEQDPAYGAIARARIAGDAPLLNVTAEVQQERVQAILADLDRQQDLFGAP